MLGVPIILTGKDNEYAKNIFTVYECPAMNTVNKDIHEYYRTHVENTNIHIIKQINNVIIQGWYKLRTGQTVKVTPNVEKILKEIQRVITNRTLLFNSINTQYMTLLEYRLYTNYFRAIAVFDSIQEVINNGNDYVFVHRFSSDTPLLRELRRNMPTIGGTNDDIVYKFDMTKESEDFTNLVYNEENDGDNDFGVFSKYTVRVVITNTIYTLLKERYPEKSVDELCFIASDIF